MNPTSAPARPKRRRWLLLAAAIVVPIAAIAIVYAVFFTPDSPKRFSIEQETKPSTSGSTPTDASSLAGAWRPTRTSAVGYRVREKLGPAPAPSDAVGRTNDVTGSATLAGEGERLRLTAARFQADLTTLKSDEARRDNRIRSAGLESDRFPTATFVLATPVDIPAAGLTGKAVDVDLAGDLTIHGVAKRVTIPAQARLDNSTIQVVGSLQFPWPDFGMSEPNIGGFVSIQGDPTLEFQLFLRQAGGTGASQG